MTIDSQTGDPELGYTTIYSAADDYLRHAADCGRRNALFGKIELEISLGCNRRCTYCNLSVDRRENYVQTRRSTMQWDLYERLLSQLVDLDYAGTVCFHFFAEPLLNKHLEKYIARCAERLPDTHRLLYSNGDLLTMERYERLMAAGLSVVFVTRHDDRVPPELEPVLRRPGVGFERRSEMVLHNRGGLLGPPTDERVRGLPCVYTAESVVVTIEGDVLPCTCDFRGQNSFGNITERSIGDIYFGPQCQTFRDDLLAGRRAKYDICRDCDSYCEVLRVPSAAESQRGVHQPTLVELRTRRGRRSPNDAVRSEDTIHVSTSLSRNGGT